MAGKGHNITNKNLKSLIERVERLEEEKAALGSDVKDVYAEAKALGHDVKSMRKIVVLRRKERETVREETENLLLMADSVDPALADALR